MKQRITRNDIIIFVVGFIFGGFLMRFLLGL